MKRRLELNFGSWAIAWITGLTALGLCLVDATAPTASATQQFFCNGRMNNGWTYSAEFLNGRFTLIRWQRSGQPPQVSNLTFRATNAQGQPIYTGAFQGATTVTLVDLSGGNVRPGSEVSVGVEEWGWARGRCTASSDGSSPGGGQSNWFTQLRQDLIGLNANQARADLRRNNFFFTQTMSHTNTRVVERWNRDSDQAIVDVVITSNRVSDVVRIR